MSAEEQTRFLQELAEDLNSKEINLPSFPDVVIAIRTALEDPKCSADRLADVVKTDAVLVARLLMAANSAFHNRAGIEIVDLDLAISRLGFEVVRNTAIALAVEQIFAASQHDDVRGAIRDIWSDSVSLASMCLVLARSSADINADNAFLCGLLHQVGRLYILTRASHFPKLLGDAESLRTLQNQWYGSVGRSIVETWGFPNEIAETLELDEVAEIGADSPLSLGEVVFAAREMLEVDDDEAVLDGPLAPIARKLKLTPDALAGIREACSLHEQSMRQSVS